MTVGMIVYVWVGGWVDNDIPTKAEFAQLELNFKSKGLLQWNSRILFILVLYIYIFINIKHSQLYIL